MPQISIVIPVYNAENNLAHCINSVLNQTFKDFELILIDDGSPDKSGEICDSFALSDNRIKVIHSGNRGASAARNSGIDIAKGKYICFIDSDDYIDKTFLSKLFDTISNSDSDMCMCSYYLDSSESDPVPQYHQFAENTLNNKQEITENILKRVVLVEDTTGLFSPWGKLFKLEIINKNLLRMDKTMSFGEDMLFVLSYIDCCEKISFIKEALYHYNQSESGLFSSYRPSFLDDIMKCYNNLKSRADMLGLPEAYLPLSLKYRYYIERHIKAGLKTEKHKLKFVFNIYRNKYVRDVFSQIALRCDDVLKNKSWNSYELRLPKLIHNGFLFSATIYSLYQYDESNILRKLKNH